MPLEKLDKLAAGASVWVAGEHDSWVLAEVTARAGSAIKVRTEKGEKLKFDMDKTEGAVFRANERVVADMTSLSHFHVPGILHNLRARALKDEPYTFLGGSVLVAVNPLKRLTIADDMVGKAQVINTAHPYAIAETAYQQLTFSASRKDEDAENQSIVVGGESGAGKTESSKYVLKHLVERGGGSKDDLDQRLLDSNPILEAFGNAATKRNPNSSRFGKFMKLHFKNKKKSRDMTIYGASVQTYLLERSRVTSHSEGERTYHVFYQLTRGGDKSLLKAVQATGDFVYLMPKAAAASSAGGGGKKNGKKSRQSMRLPDLSSQDKANFKELTTALTTIGIADGADVNQTDLFSVVSALLHLGNVRFVENPKGDGDEAMVENEDAIETAASLMGLKAKHLSALFIERKVKTVGEEIIAKRDAESAKIALDAVVKNVYSNLFDWLVRKVTMSLSEKGDYADYPFIGVLDIFGFETFALNDFEQLLINYTNEALQNTFNQQIFEAEAMLYEKEGLLVDSSERQAPPDNFETMMLLGGKKGDKSNLGVLSLIDAETNAPQASDDKLVTNLHRTFKKNKLFPAPHPKDIKHCFIVQHYAGQVKYTVGKFIQKNVDKLPAEVTEVLAKSKAQLVQEMYEDASTGSGETKAARAVKKSTSTIAGKFKLQIEELISTLGATKASFIRCIKPNAQMQREKKGDVWFNNLYVMVQLQNLSIPQTAEVLRGGLPTRLPFDLLLESYRNALPGEAIQAWETLGQGDERLFVKALFAAFDIPADTYKMGLTRVFFRAGMLESLNEVLDSATSGEVDPAVVDRFRSSFARSIWRRAYAKALAYNRFKRLLEACRERQSAITILQRLARRRLEILEAKAELAMLREAKRKADEKEAKRKAEQARKEEERLKKEKKKARKKAERERIEREQMQQQAMAEEAEERARRMHEEEEEAIAARAELEEAREHARQQAEEETSRAIEEIGGKEAYDEQRKREREAKDKTGLRISGEDDEEEESKTAADPERVEEIKRKAEKNRKSMRKSLSRRLKSRSTARDFGGLKVEVAKPVVFEDVRYKVVSTARKGAGGPFACLFGGGKKKEEMQRNENGDSWSTCVIIISGINLNYYRSLTEDKDGQPVGEGLLGQVKIDSRQTDMEGVKGVGEEDGLVRFTVHSRREQILFRLLDTEMNDELIKAYETAAKQFEKELEAAAQFERGEFGGRVDDDETKEWREWLKKGWIKPEEFEVLINQQVSSLDEYVAYDAGQYGEEGVADYRVSCEDCGEIYFLVPGTDLKECNECGTPLPASPEELAREAEIIRQQKMRQAQRRGTDAVSVAGSEEPSCLVTRDLDGQRLFLEEPEVRKVNNNETFQVVYYFDFEARLQIYEEPPRIEEWSFMASWSEFKGFAKLLCQPNGDIQHPLEEEYRDLVPPFPKDVPRNSNKAERAQQRMELVAQWVHDLCAADLPTLFEVPFVRRFFIMPVDAALVASRISEVRVLTLEEVTNVMNLADEMTAAVKGGKKPSEAAVNAIKSIKDSIEASDDPERVFSDLSLQALTDEEKMGIIERASRVRSALAELGF